MNKYIRVTVVFIVFICMIFSNIMNGKIYAGNVQANTVNFITDPSYYNNNDMNTAYNYIKTLTGNIIKAGKKDDVKYLFKAIDVFKKFNQYKIDSCISLIEKKKKQRDAAYGRLNDKITKLKLTISSKKTTDSQKLAAVNQIKILKDEWVNWQKVYISDRNNLKAALKKTQDLMNCKTVQGVIDLKKKYGKSLDILTVINDAASMANALSTNDNKFTESSLKTLYDMIKLWGATTGGYSILFEITDTVVCCIGDFSDSQLKVAEKYFNDAYNKANILNEKVINMRINAEYQGKKNWKSGKKDYKYVNEATLAKKNLIKSLDNIDAYIKTPKSKILEVQVSLQGMIVCGVKCYSVKDVLKNYSITMRKLIKYCNTGLEFEVCYNRGKSAGMNNGIKR